MYEQKSHEKRFLSHFFLLQWYVVMYFLTAQPEQYMSTPGILCDFKVIISNDNDFENPSLRSKTYKLTEIYIYMNVSSSSLFLFSLIMNLPKFRVIPAKWHVYQNHYGMESYNVFHTVWYGIIYLLVVTILIVSWQNTIDVWTRLFICKQHCRLSQCSCNQGCN